MRVTIFRHGQSTANAGEASENPATIPLTALGCEQAVCIAESIRRSPTLIVTSPFIRTKATALPLHERFPEVPSEEWPVQEFTYLPSEPLRGTTRTDRAEFATAFWNRGDPTHREGEGTESLNDLFGRVRDMFDRLNKLDPDADVTLFGHGMFMRAVLWGILTNVWTMTPELMQSFRSFCFALTFPNGVAMPLFSGDGCWKVGALEIAHIPRDRVSI